MGAAYYYYGDDGVLREFDENKDFIPSENVTAFVAGQAFDWDQLKSYGTSSSGSTGTSKSTTLTASTAKKRRLLREEMEENVDTIEDDYEEQEAAIEEEALADARQAYIDRRISGRDGTAGLAAAGLRGGEQDELLSRLEQSYLDAVRTINLQRAKRLTAAQKKRDSAIESEEAAYRRAIQSL